MVGRSNIGAGMCVGTSAVYRRKAIQEAGGPPRVNGTEDVRQGLLLMKYGYKIKYLPLVLSIGLSPNTIQGYFRQHMRWCEGSTETIFSKYFFQAKMGFLARLVYISNFTFYLSSALTILVSFHILTLLNFHYNELNFRNVIWFIPEILLAFVFPFFYRINKPKLGLYLAANVQIFTYWYTFIMFILKILFKVKTEWISANQMSQNVDRHFSRMTVITTLLFSIFTLSFIYVLVSTGNNLFFIEKTGLLMFWIIYSLTIQFILICYIQLDSIGKLLKNYRISLISFRYYYKYILLSLIPFLLSLIALFLGIFIYFLRINFDILPKNYIKPSEQLEMKLIISSPVSSPISYSEIEKETIKDIKSNNEVVKEEKKIEPANRIISKYLYSIQGGESLSKGYRSIIQKYINSQNIFIENYQKIYVETNLIQSDTRVNRIINENERVEVSRERLEYLIFLSKNISSIEIYEWKRIAQSVDFSADFSRVETLFKK